MIDVFVSRPTWVAPEFEPGLKGFLARLRDLEMQPRTIGATDYPTRAPLDEVIRLLEQCKGAVILGYPQIIVSQGTIKAESVNDPVFLATEWNHIEAGLAYARGLPLLVIHHVGVIRGVFDRGAINRFLFAKQLDTPTWCFDDDISGALRTWRDEVLGFKPTMQGVRNSVFNALEARRNELWTVRGIGRRIADPQPLEDGYREEAECRIDELNEFYVRMHSIGSGQHYTVPLGDITISYDEGRYRAMIEVRKKGA